MKDSKLVLFLETFSVYELNRFRKFLVSPFFNAQDILVQLFDLLKPYLKNTANIPDKESIWTSLFPKIAYNDTRFRRLCSDLLQLVQDFMHQLEYEKEAHQVNKNKLQAFLNRDLKKYFSNELNQSKALLNAATHRSVNYYQNLYELSLINELFIIKMNSRNVPPDTAEAAHLLDCSFIAQKLQLYCDSLNYKNVIKKEVPISGTDSLLEWLANDTVLAEIPVIKIYYTILQTLLHPDNKTHFETLTQLLEQYIALFPQNELHNFYTFALNYCIKKINSGNTDFYKEIFSLYKRLLENKIIFQQNQLLPWDYKNIVTISLRLGEFNWMERFIREYNDLLPNDFRQNALIYNLARLHFAKRQFPKVIKLLREVEYQDMFYSLDSKIMLLKTYYELEEIDAMESFIETFRIFLIRHKTIPEITRKQYLNFLRFSKKLVQISYSDKKSQTILLKKVEESADIIDKQWLIQKINDL